MQSIQNKFNMMKSTIFNNLNVLLKMNSEVLKSRMLAIYLEIQQLPWMLLKHLKLEPQTNKKSINNNISQLNNTWPQFIILLRVKLLILRKEEEIMKMPSMPLMKLPTFWLPSIVDLDLSLKSVEFLRPCSKLPST